MISPSRGRRGDDPFGGVTQCGGVAPNLILRRKSILLHLGSPQSVLADTFGETASEPLAPTPNLRNNQQPPNRAGLNEARKYCIFGRRHSAPVSFRRH